MSYRNVAITSVLYLHRVDVHHNLSTALALAHFRLPCRRYVYVSNDFQIEKIPMHLCLKRFHLRADRLVEVCSAGRGWLLQWFEYHMLLENRQGLHSCDAGQDGEDLVVPRRGKGGVEEELMHAAKGSDWSMTLQLQIQ